MQHPVFILNLSCRDQQGIVASVAGFLAQQGCNILESAQFFDAPSGQFFLRTQAVSEQGRDIVSIREAFQHIASTYAMHWRLEDQAIRQKVLIMVSKFDHCLHALLYQHQTGTLPMDVVGIISNHSDLQPLADFYNIPFQHLPVTPATKAIQEQALIDFIEQHSVDLVVLARYMQVLSDDLCQVLPGKVINIHHSFLPSFKGAKPYHQAHLRGVKIIGATAHYVTCDLDEGPIIDQETARISHAHTPEQMIVLGRHLESLVLTRAVQYHLERRVILHGNRTVVFSA